MDTVHILKYNGYSNTLDYCVEDSKLISGMLKMPQIVEVNLIGNIYYIKNKLINSKYQLNILGEKIAGSIWIYKRTQQGDVLTIDDEDKKRITKNLIKLDGSDKLLSHGV